jgi:hypothetical protein
MGLTAHLVPEIPPAERTVENPNPAINGWCSRCREWTLRSRAERCLWCDRPLRDEPGGERL